MWILVSSVISERIASRREAAVTGRIEANDKVRQSSLARERAPTGAASVNDQIRHT